MSSIPQDRHYAKSHEWAKPEPDGTMLVGITDYAQSALGDITYVQLPKAGATLAAGTVFGVVESVKAASDLYAPVGGTVVEVNGALDSAPETLNQDPYARGWMLRIRPASPDLSGLMDAAAYGAILS